jgi:hypothetical protein
MLCRHNRGMSAKCADIWLSLPHVADILETFPVKCFLKQSLAQSLHDCLSVVVMQDKLRGQSMPIKPFAKGLGL